MTIKFSDGYKSAVSNIGGAIGAEVSIKYVDNVQQSIDEFTQILNTVVIGSKKNVDQLKGDVFEFWHAGTFNIDATINDTREHARAIRESKFASADILTSWQEYYGLKDCGDGMTSAKAQATSFLEYYNLYIRNKQKLSFEEYLIKQGYNNPEDLFNSPIYEGQARLIPKDQIPGAIEWLKFKIAKEKVIRPELVEKYRETLEKITDKISSPRGAESLPISEEETRKIALEARAGSFDAKRHGISTEESVKMEHILNQSLRAGTTAAILTAILRVAPEVIKTIRKIYNDEHISLYDLQDLGFSCLSASSQSFIRGYIAACLTATCKSGLAGNALKTVDPFLIGVATAIAINSINNAIKMVRGKIDQNEFADSCMRDLFIALFAYGGIILFQAFIKLPYLGAIFGNIIGSLIGTLLYSPYKNLFLSFCASTGYTFLGIVDQDYTLPDDILSEMGLDIVVYDRCEPDTCEPDICEPDLCEPEFCQPDVVSSYILRRGVIGINKIGYVLE